jgi:hypothetical protein
MAKRKNIVKVSRAGVRADQAGVQTKPTRSVHGRKGSRPAGNGGMPYQPKQCTAKKESGDRCQRVIKNGQVCSAHA